MKFINDNIIYKYVSFLSKGNFASVFLFLNEKNYPVVFKFIDDYEIYLNEVNILKKIFYQNNNIRMNKSNNMLINIAYYYDSGSINNINSEYNEFLKYLNIYIENKKYYYFIITNYINGTCLDKLNLEKMTKDFFIKFMHDMLVALLLIQSKKISHKDIYESNIMYDTSNNLFVLIDFGNSCFENEKTCINYDWYYIYMIIYNNAYLVFPEFYDYFDPKLEIKKTFQIYETLFGNIYTPSYYDVLNFIEEKYLI